MMMVLLFASKLLKLLLRAHDPNHRFDGTLRMESIEWSILLSPRNSFIVRIENFCSLSGYQKCGRKLKVANADNIS